MPPAGDGATHRHDLSGLTTYEIPLRLARIHAETALGDQVDLAFDESSFDGPASSPPTASLSALIGRGGFDIDHLSTTVVRAHRVNALPDQVAADLDVLVVGLNPSLYSAETGVAYGRPGNRFWPAARASGLLTIDRDPTHAVLHHRVGFTDLVRRPTRRADELSRAEFVEGHRHLTDLTEWLTPGVVCVVGLGGWRAAVDRSTVAGLQQTELAGRPVYVMPSTSGLNASSSLADLTEHLRSVQAIAAKQKPIR